MKMLCLAVSVLAASLGPALTAEIPSNGNANSEQATDHLTNLLQTYTEAHPAVISERRNEAEDLKRLYGELNSLLIDYTEAAPRVQEKRFQIANLEAKLQQTMPRPSAFEDAVSRKMGCMDLLYTSSSFLRKNHRWPSDYSELSTYVRQSNGYLTLGDYQRVDFRQLPDGGVELCFVPAGITNEVRLALPEPAKLSRTR